MTSSSSSAPQTLTKPAGSSVDLHLLTYLIPSFLAMAWLMQKASWFWNHQPDLSFGWIMIFLCGFLFWESWGERPALRLKPAFSSVVLLTVGLGLLFVFQIYQVALGLKPAALCGLAMAVLAVVAANLHFVFGWRGVKSFLFPYAFILIALPMPSVVQGIVVNGLQNQVAYVTVEILALIGIPADLTGSVIHLGVGPVGVDEACSGIRSLQSTIMATLFIGFLMFKGLGIRIFLLLSGVCLAVFGNLVRVFFLCYQAHHHGLEAIDAAHDAAGWSILIFTIAGVGALSYGLAKLQAMARAIPVSKGK